MAKKEYTFPTDLFYDGKNHMWLKKDGDNHILVGIDAIGLDTLGDLAYITLKPKGTEVKKGESIGTLEAAKMTGDIFAPVSGKIISINNACVENPGIVNEDQYNKGWLVSIEATEWENENNQLISGENLQPWIEAEIHRMETQGFDA
ncbi:MAG: glycine cleavage system protein H [Calditrichaeota bacterium]|nr:MAG: glycine cleavage system protein H [Calditrichota bacterium]MBL1207093.1 glycine cleavage system protein H [Calditrichota bacterium]NOG46923.1 glycine cleavage system protein H [Calditrichota bacterium]